MNDRLDQLIEGLPQERQPHHDLWPNIEAQLDRAPVEPPVAPSKSAPRSWVTWALAASVIVCSSASFWLGSQQGLSQGQQLIATLAAQHQIQLNNLKERQQSFRHAGYAANAEQAGLDSLRETAQELRQALEQDPADTQLLTLWLSVQQRELQLIQNQQHRQQRLQQL